MDPRVLLNNHLAGTLRENFQTITVDLPREDGVHRAKLSIGLLSFVGKSADEAVEARKSAAVIAYRLLGPVNDEALLREYLGLQPRTYIKQVDGIRDKVRVLRARVRDELSQSNRRAANALLGKFIAHADNVEEQLMGFGLGF